MPKTHPEVVMSDSSREKPASPPSASERRASIRYLCSLDVSCQANAYGKEQRWPGSVHDVSREGLGLVLPHAFDAGTVLGVELHSPETDLTYTMFAKVMHVEPLADNTWRTGCLFVRKLSDEELQGML